MVNPLHGFLLTRQWRDTPAGIQLEFWATGDNGPTRVLPPLQPAVCFMPRHVRWTESVPGLDHRRPVALSNPAGEPVDGLYFRNQQHLVAFRETALGAHALEADVRPVERFLMERFITAGIEVSGTRVRASGFNEIRDARLRPHSVAPSPKLASVDIETSDLDGELYSIAVAGNDGHDHVFMISDPPQPPVNGVSFYADPRALLSAFLAFIADTDPDIIVGWNLIQFDLSFLARLARRLRMRFNLGRAGQTAAILPPSRSGQPTIARIPGRAALDGIEMLRQAFWRFEDFSLETVARELLGRGKVIHDPNDRVAEIRRLFAQNKAALAAYNLADCRLVLDIFAHTDLLHFAIERARLTGLALDRLGGSVAAFDNLYLPRLHRLGRVAPSIGQQTSRQQSPGGFVLDSIPGLYDNVLLLDFKSLYPSIMRTFHIDPFGLWAPGDDPIPGFLDAQFSRTNSILPGLLTELWKARDAAKAAGDKPLSQAVKIIMNSFYGVLGSSGCRFFDPRLASSITRRGHEIIQASRDRIEANGLKVIYGDTDSLFVLLGSRVSADDAARRGGQIAGELNDWWRKRLANDYRLDSYLEIEFETLFRKFLMPTTRAQDSGSKKRYAGLAGNDDHPELIIKGLESVRTDWTPLAREFQRELLRRAFSGLPVAGYVREIVAEMDAGAHDDKLVYRKRLRQPISEYQRQIPPHVQAAKKSTSPDRWIRYVITPSGPEPVDTGPHRLDHEHYRSRQLAPAADAILPFLGTSFEELTSAQLRMF